jgi:hypothetical protein
VKLKLVLIGFFVSVLFGELALAEPLRELIRPFEQAGSVRPVYPVRRLLFEGLYSEVYVYQNILDSAARDPKSGHSSEFLERKLIQVARFFDQEVCPRFKNLFGIDPLEGFGLGPGRRNDKIILLFDSDLRSKGYHSRTLTELYHRDFILFDVLENLDSNALKYRLPHELQHVIRYHFNRSEVDWLNEGLSIMVESLFNEEFPIGYLEKYNNLGGLTLFEKFDKENSSENYFNNFMFIYYLYHHYGGIRLIRELMKSPHSGVNNLNAQLVRLKPKNQQMAQYFTFERAFSNYQLALILNPYRDRIESFGFFDLMLNRANLPSRLHDYSTRSGILPTKTPISLPPGTSNFYDLEEKCFSIEVRRQSTLLLVLIDMSSTIPSQAIQILQNHKKYCVQNLLRTGQILAIINSDPEKSQPFLISPEG